MSKMFNNWNVEYCRITFLERVLKNHPNIFNLKRSKDILFSFERIKQKDSLNLLCLDSYVFGENDLYKVLEEFPNVDIICIGSMWNRYTRDAKKLALQRKLGLYRIDEINGGIYFDKFWLYHKKDEEGNPTYCFGSL
ncbi:MULTISPECIES: hypothetical protein [Acinetobacter calcoaceticus/baumannii complex]|uniref:hypothetical protein n=1 Tax=Acinetobacter calcoaceticus/baumannii complex TaxID=909768 RepID=UPI001CD5165D|nr:MULTISPECIES: hypothetical protein [Acinetobacter calcoaceticus/baumannii complex]MDC5353494.1 hypothetical protein [Acinetobacter baumannii]MDH2534199.1 hypothetical protein [Acinetobacter baumannii]WIH74635.1 hypothetical protein M2A29_00920 [Acinetobacter baumannii]HEO1777148.1 hypothetical protein [Acinetobacter baumannii]